MHYFEYPSVDTTLYQASQSLNTGLDAVLEVRKDVSPTGDTVNVSRILIKFDLIYSFKVQILLSIDIFILYFSNSFMSLSGVLLLKIE